MSNPFNPTSAALAPGDSALPDKGGAAEALLSDVAHKDLKRRTAHGALVSIGSQAANFVLRTGSLMILARLLVPEDFGLVGMVAAFTGFLGLFRDAGLSMATVQRATITREQTSTLFWVNVAVGGLLAALTALGAPILAAFYREPRLFWVTAALGLSFLFNGAAAQHRAILQRTMRFAAIAIIDITALVLSIGIAVGMALFGFGYWALVAMTVALPVFGGAGAWLATRWIPGRPQRGCGIRSMLWFGGTVTLNSVVSYVTYNADKVLLGRFLGAEALGIYGRACQLINLPTENLNSSLSMVALPALARVQNDPARLRSYFLKGYSMFLALVLPITMGCAFFADDIVRVLLGAKWHAAAGIFRLMAPTIVAFALINPFGWLLMATGRAVRSLKISLSIAPIVVMSYAVGLRQGTHGVAAGFSIAMVAMVAPVVWWAKQETTITARDILGTAIRPLLSILAGAVVAWSLASLTGRLEPVLLRLTVESSILFGTYFVILMFVLKQWTIYTSLFRETGLGRGGQPAKEPVQ